MRAGSHGTVRRSSSIGTDMFLLQVTLRHRSGDVVCSLRCLPRWEQGVRPAVVRLAPQHDMVSHIAMFAFLEVVSCTRVESVTAGRKIALVSVAGP